MHDDEAIRKELHKFRETKWIDRRMRLLARRPGPKHDALRQILSPGRQMRNSDAERKSTASAYLCDLSHSDRRAHFEGIFPRLAGHVERAWIDASNRPYQTSYRRKPFRAPSNERVAAEVRTAWFLELCAELWSIDQGPEWVAAWLGHIALPDYGSVRPSGWLLSRVLSAGGAEADAVRHVLLDTMNGEHEFAVNCESLMIALLNSGDRQDWESVGGLLLAAKRQEGLRQVILESVDEAPPEAFRYMLGLILEHDLSRFSSVVRAFDVWLGFQWAGGSAKVVTQGIKRLTEFFDDPEERASAIKRGTPEDAYLALWVEAYQDADRAIECAQALFDDEAPERRYVATELIASRPLKKAVRMAR